jgi:hypothetical protein
MRDGKSVPGVSGDHPDVAAVARSFRLPYSIRWTITRRASAGNARKDELPPLAAAKTKRWSQLADVDVHVLEAALLPGRDCVSGAAGAVARSAVPHGQERGRVVVEELGK